MTVPKLRFREFDNDWLATNLGEVCSHFQSGKSITSKNINDSHGFPVYGGNGLRGFTDTFTHEGKFVLVGRQGALCGNVNLVDGINYISEHAIAIQANTDNSTDLLAYWLDKMKLNRFSEASAQPGLAVNKLVKFKIVLPALKEQTEIASFLSTVDDKIAQLTQEHELLSEYKKGIMQQLFSQKLRFKADDGSDFIDWEYMSLNEVLDYEQPTKYIVESTDYDDSFKTPVLTAGKSFILGFTDEDSCIFEAQKQNVIIFDDFTTAYKFVDFPFKVKSSAMKILKTKSENYDIFYIYLVFSIINLPKGAEHKRRWISEYSQIEIPMPSLPEQTKIANFLSAIDQKIDNVAAQIDQAQVWKKGLLQQMFV